MSEPDRIHLLNFSIVREISKALESLGADRELLATVGSWGDSLDDDEVLGLLRTWNAERSAHTVRIPLA